MGRQEGWSYQAVLSARLSQVPLGPLRVIEPGLAQEVQQALISCFSLSLAMGFLSEEGASVRSALLNQGHEGSTLKGHCGFWYGRVLGSLAPWDTGSVVTYW